MAHAAANVHPTSADQQVDGLLLLAQAEGSLVVRNGRIDGPSPVQDGGQKAIRQREIRRAVAVWPDRGHQPATRPAGRVEATKRPLGIGEEHDPEPGDDRVESFYRQVVLDGVGHYPVNIGRSRSLTASVDHLRRDVYAAGPPLRP